MASALPTANDCCSACSGISVTVTTATAATTTLFYDTIAALRAGASPTASDMLAIVRGDAAAWDGGGGDYIWVSNSTATDDGINYIKPSDKAVGDQGRWRKQI